MLLVWDVLVVSRGGVAAVDDEVAAEWLAEAEESKAGATDAEEAATAAATTATEEEEEASSSMEGGPVELVGDLDVLSTEPAVVNSIASSW